MAPCVAFITAAFCHFTSTDRLAEEGHSPCNGVRGCRGTNLSVDEVHDGIAVVAAAVCFVILCQGADDLRTKCELEMRSGISRMRFN